MSSSDSSDPVLLTFNSCVNSEISIMGAVGRLTQIFLEDSSEKFVNAIEKSIRVILVNAHKNSEIHRAIELLTNFAVSSEIVKRIPANDLDESLFEIDPIFYTIVKIIISYTKADSRDVRVLVCSLISKIMEMLSKDIKLEISLIDEITNAMIDRISDLNPLVRAKAISAISRLQNPEDSQCPIIEAYLKALENDLNVNVRKAVVQNICITSNSLSPLIDRIRDKNSIVRRLTYERLGRSVSIKTLNIDQRTLIISSGLQETDKDAQNEFRRLLIDSWFNLCCNNEFLIYVNLFDVFNDYDVLKQSLKYIRQHTDLSSLYETYNELTKNFMGMNDKFTFDNNECEKIFLWSNTTSSILIQEVQYPSLFESIVPEVLGVCKLIEKFISQFNEHLSQTQCDNYSVMLKELILLLCSFSLNDEAGRKFALNILSRILQSPKLDLSIVPSAIKSFIHFSTTPSKALDSIIEIISEIRQPLTDAQDTKSEGTLTPNAPQKTPEVVSTQNSVPEDPEILLLCLTITAEMLKVKNADLTSPSILSLIHSFILPLVQDPRPEIRRESIRCLSICCVCVRQYAQKYIVLLSHIVSLDVKEVKLIAISALFDIFTVYGVEVVGNENSHIDESSDSGTSLLEKQLENETDEEILAILISGFSKLFLYKRIFSTSILSSLINFYLNPKYEKDSRIKQILGLFFRNFVQIHSAESDNTLSESLFISIKHILLCSPDSPFSQVEFVHIINFASNLITISDQAISNPETTISFGEKMVFYFLSKISEPDESHNFYKDLLRIISSLHIPKVTSQGSDEIKKALPVLEELFQSTNDQRSIRYIKKIEEFSQIRNSVTDSSIISSREKNA